MAVKVARPACSWKYVGNTFFWRVVNCGMERAWKQILVMTKLCGIPMVSQPTTWGLVLLICKSSVIPCYNDMTGPNPSYIPDRAPYQAMCCTRASEKAPEKGPRSRCSTWLMGMMGKIEYTKSRLLCKQYSRMQFLGM